MATLQVPTNKPSLSRQVWLYGLGIPLLYLIAEFSLNHQLISLLGETVSDEALDGLEFWGRVISGVGLGLLIHRFLNLRRGRALLSLVVCLGVGIVVMWNVQRSVIDYFVDIASPEDKQAALALAWVAPLAADGGLQTLNGDRLMVSEVSGLRRNIVLAMFPAAALHMTQRQTQLQQWLNAAGLSAMLSDPSVANRADNAYKNLILPPVAIGLSIFFALVNLCAVLAFLVGTLRPRWRTAVMGLSLCVCVGASVVPPSAFLDSDGYRNSLRAGLWEAKPVLAILVEWSCQASSTWGRVSAFIHQNLAFNFRFGLPTL